MAWRTRGGRRWRWESSVAMVAAPPRGKIEKPQDYAKSTGCHPAPGRGGAGRAGARVLVRVSPSQRPTPPCLPPAGDPGRTVFGWRQVAPAGGPSPTPARPPTEALVRVLGWGWGPGLPGRGRQGLPHSAGVPRPGTQGRRPGLGWGAVSHPQTSPNRRGPRVGVGRAPGGGSRDLSPARSWWLHSLQPTGDIPPR